MKKFYFHLLAVLCLWAALPWGASAEERNPQAVTDLLNRIGGNGAADKFVTVLDDALASSAAEEVFVITAADGKPCIKGSTLSALTTGINWYLNHYAHVNLTWNRLTTDLTAASLPVPSQEERRTTTTDYRYYLNYCTFSYSMSTWTWERWQQEIDWMALHGINMPLQIVGLDVVWQKLLTEDLGYTKAEANDFIAGPCFQAWWGMNNLEGWGGPNPDWWYERQETLCKNILARQRELGMQPVLPGYAGMVPSDINEHGYAAQNQGNWCNFVRPYILDLTGEAFADISAKYYKRLTEVMGTSEYYSMDPFHEGANTGGIDVPKAYKAINDAMLSANADAKWVIQYWQWSAAQYEVLNQVDKGKLVILDLFSDAHTHFGEYKGHDAVYCMLHNFGGRTGFYGRLTKIMTDYYAQKARHGNIKGVGATPEAIETVPILYDALFELPWRDQAPDAARWVKDYTESRYGTANADAQAAWEKLRTSSLNCETGLQGPMEAVLCARPALSVGAVSSWGGTGIFYDAQEVLAAAHLLLNAGLSGENYSYDLTDIARQALTDYGYYLLQAVNDANNSKDADAFATRRDLYLNLILDLDRLLNTNKEFMLGRWTQLARGIADEATGTGDTDRQWLELNNARTLITTWGDQAQSEGGGLRDYSYREWGGMMKDFYYDRWKIYFDNLAAGKNQPDWFTHDWNWAHNASLSYANVPDGNTADVAAELFAKYFLTVNATDGAALYVYRGFAQDETKRLSFEAYRGESFTVPVTLPAGVTATLSVDTDNDGRFADTETTEGLSATIPATAVTGNVKARLNLSDGTVLTFTLVLKDNITTPRTVSVRTADAAQGSVAIEGVDGLSVTNTDAVTIKATPAAGYDFTGWTVADGTTVSNDNPYTYYGKEEQTFTANFIVSKWTIPAEDLSEHGTIKEYSQYVSALTLTQNGGDPATLYEADACPEQLFQTTAIANVPAGSRFTLAWNDPSGGLSYCRLSAYIDLNSDGDFDDEGEFLQTIGSFGTSGNSNVSNGTLTVTLPYDVPQGITHLRLRFDSSWKKDDLNDHDAVKPDAATKRMVYDVPVNVTNAAASACTVTVKAGDSHGTADANGQPETYTYGVGEEIVLRAYPASGYTLDYWTDQYGRRVPAEWVDGNFLRFFAPESGTYTAHFTSKKVTTVGNWQLNYDDEADGIVITGVEYGSGALDLAARNTTGKAVVRLTATALKGNTDLTALNLPATLTEMDRSLETNFTGAGVESALITPAATIRGDRPWTLRLSATSNGTSFNEWGSALLATGSGAFENAYNNGFQLYLAAAGTLTVKVGGTENKFSANLGSSFAITMGYDGAGSLKVTATAADGTTETKTLAQQLNDITTFSTALPAGVDITSLVIVDPMLHSAPLAGCTALTDITVAEGNATFSARNGSLYTADGSAMVAWPEGRLTRRAFSLAAPEADGRYVTAAPWADATGTDVLADDHRGVALTAAADLSLPQALWTLVPIDGGYKVEHVNSQRFWGSGNNSGDIEMPTSATEWHGTYTYDIKVDIDGPVIELTLADGSRSAAAGSNGTVCLSDAATAWCLADVATIPVTITDALWTALCLPVPVVVPEADAALVYKAVSTSTDNTTLQLVALAPGTVVAAGEGVLVSAAEAGTVNLAVSYDAAGTRLTDNLLSGATIRRSGLTAETFYALGNEAGVVGFYLSHGDFVPANKAYLLKSSLPASAAGAFSFRFGDVTGIGGPLTDEGQAAPAYYDLNGRRVLYPAHGIFVTADGRKVYIP